MKSEILTKAHHRWMKLQSMRMMTRACEKAYVTSRLYSRLLLYNNAS